MSMRMGTLKTSPGSTHCPTYEPAWSQGYVTHTPPAVCCSAQHAWTHGNLAYDNNPAWHGGLTTDSAVHDGSLRGNSLVNGDTRAA